MKNGAKTLRRKTIGYRHPAERTHDALRKLAAQICNIYFSHPKDPEKMFAVTIAGGRFVISNILQDSKTFFDRQNISAESLMQLCFISEATCVLNVFCTSA